MTTVVATTPVCPKLKKLEAAVLNSEISQKVSVEDNAYS
jgi:hypothetical protein